MKKIKFTLQILMLSCFSGSGILSAQKYDQIIKTYLNSEKGPFQRIDEELKTFTIINVDHSKSLKGDVVGIQQTINGIPIFGSSANVLIRDNKVLSFANTFINTYPSSIKGKQTSSKDALISEAVKKFNGLTTSQSSEGKEIPIKTNLIYFAKGGELILGYQFNIEEKETGNLLTVIISTIDGTVLYRENLNLSCNFHNNAYEHIQQELPTEGQNAQAVVLPEYLNNEVNQFNKNSVLAPDNASYNVLPLPVEAPSFGSRILLNNPWDLTASPDGWHFDGTTHYTNTRGNNVFAYTDENATNTPQFSPDGGANRAFDFPMDVTLPPHNYTSAAITNLFYVNNKIHDVFYKFGFTETSRNFQTNNFAAGGAGNDAVLAEARDGAGYNNANFQSPADGYVPRMQMYLYEPAQIQNLFYNSPSVFTIRKPSSKKATFGPTLEGNPPITGDLALTTPQNGCSDISENLMGKIALIQRGGCNYTVKVKNAQLKGAVGVVVYNTPASVGFAPIGGTDASITIPSILIENSEGSFLVNEIMQGTLVNVTLKDDKSTYIYNDASLDNGIIIHEYGHGISNRMTGIGSDCLNSYSSNEQMGEGWSDFFALMLTNKPGDNASVARGVGTFALGQNTNGGGLRSTKYSPDFTINNYTYGKTNGMVINENVLGSTLTSPDAHSIGFVWASMLWDLNWKYVEKYGYNSNVLADPNSGSARVLQVVLDALKLQQCNPSFVQGRDAILAADQATTGGDNKCLIWNVFAKRGLGMNASPGGLNGYASFNNLPEMSDQVEDFTVPTECATLALKEINNSKGLSIYPNPVRNEFTIKTPSDIKLSGITTVSIFDFTGKLISRESINLNKQNTISADKLINGAYIVKVSNDSLDYSQKIIVSK